MTLTAAMGFLLLGYWFAYYNGLTKIIHKQYVYQGKQVIASEDLFNSLISGLIPFGAIFGSFLINPLVGKGRRISLIFICFLLIIGTLFTMIFNMYTLIFGRLLMGIWIGMYATVCPLYVSEVLPPSLAGSFGSMNQLMAVSGVTLGFSTAFILPLPYEKEALTTGLWRIPMIIPLFLAGIQIILLLFIFRYDTPIFYKIRGDTKNYKIINELIYSDFKIESEKIDLEEDNQVDNSSNTKQDRSVHKADDRSKSQLSILDDRNENSEEKKDSEIKNKGKENSIKSTKILKNQNQKKNNSKENIIAKSSNNWPAHYKKGKFWCFNES